MGSLFAESHGEGAVQYPALRALDLSGTVSLSQLKLDHLLCQSPQLEFLCLEGIGSMAHVLADPNMRLPTLKKLDIGKCRGLTRQLFDGLLKACPNLDQVGLDFVDFSGQGGAWGREVFANRSWQGLSLKNAAHADIISSALYGSGLKTLDLSSSEISDEDLSGAPTLLSVTRLNLANCASIHDSFTPSWWPGPPRHPALAVQDLNVRQCAGLTHQGLKNWLACCPDLHTLDMGQCSKLNARAQVQALAGILRGGPKLQTVRLSKHEIGVETTAENLKAALATSHSTLNVELV